MLFTLQILDFTVYNITNNIDIKIQYVTDFKVAKGDAELFKNDFSKVSAKKSGLLGFLKFFNF